MFVLAAYSYNTFSNDFHVIEVVLEREIIVVDRDALLTGQYIVDLIVNIIPCTNIVHIFLPSLSISEKDFLLSYLYLLTL